MTFRDYTAIDLFGLNEAAVLARFPQVYQHLLETVKPERDENRDPARRRNWWLFARSNEQLRNAISGLSRYIATVQTSKYCTFTFLEGAILPDDKLIAIGLDDAYYLGILSSRVHIVWALATGGRLGVGNDPVYDKTRCFDPFPFPVATPDQQARIRELAEQLDAHRKRQQAQHPALTLTDLYNVVEKLRAGQPLTAKEQATNERGLASVVLSLHQQLDAAVAAAYGWPTDLPDAELLTRLVALNHERQREEQAGTVRYLRPAYQAPGQQQGALSLGSTGPAAVVTTDTTAPQPWPGELAQQMQAVRAIVTQAAAPVTAAQVAARFRRTRAAQVQPLLATLTALALLRHLDTENTYAA